MANYADRIIYRQFTPTVLKLNPSYLYDIGRLFCEVYASEASIPPIKNSEACQIAEELLTDALKYNQNFFGATAYDVIENRVVGATWGFLESWEDIEANWNCCVCALLNDGNPEGATNLSELFVDEKYRLHGIGSHLLLMTTSWMNHNYPSLPSFLHVNEGTPASHLFEKAGYTKFSDDAGHFRGDVLMEVYTCSKLKPENFKSK